MNPGKKKPVIPKEHEKVLFWIKDRAKTLARCMNRDGIKLFGAITRGVLGQKTRRTGTLAWWSKDDAVWVINDQKEFFKLIKQRGMILVELDKRDFYARTYEEFDELSD